MPKKWKEKLQQFVIMYYDIVSEPDMTVQDDFAFEYAIPEQEISKEIEGEFPQSASYALAKGIRIVNERGKNGHTFSRNTMLF